MCEFCGKHGDGQKWYLNARNYSDALLAEKHDRIHYYLGNSHEEFIKGHQAIDRIASLPFIGKLVLNSKMFQRALHKGVFGQALPIEDVKKIFQFVKSICLFPCICRQMSYNRKEELYCFGVSLGNFEDRYLARYPDVTLHMEKVTKEKAISLMEGFEEQGSFHSVWTMSTPFIATICNCNGRDCLSVKQRLSYGVKSFFKSEYVGRIKSDSCTGCRECMKLCNFGAIHFSPSLGKCDIHPKICFGCGICRKFCPIDAIFLMERASIPGIRDEW